MKDPSPIVAQHYEHEQLLERSGRESTTQNSQPLEYARQAGRIPRKNATRSIRTNKLEGHF
jgi:hypothetical protein